MRLIDTHHHFLLDFYVQGLEEAGGDPTGWPTPSWSIDSSMSLMEKVGSTKAILSLTAPGALRGSLAEIRYALDILKADGVTLFTRYGSGNQYFGHPAFKPIWEELNSRNAVVFVHPTHGSDTTPTNRFLPLPAIDYPHETTRAAMDMITTNTKRTYSSCKVILSHAGGSLPYLISRVSTVSKEAPATAGMFGKSAAEVKEDFRSFYFDLALSSSEAVLRMILDLVPHDHILYVGFKQILDGFPLDQELREKVYYKNADVLFAKRD
ncbi:2-amino-3-carboxymuconate-6-semialdehyde decarboxylase [Aspergillus germanicus]